MKHLTVLYPRPNLYDEKNNTIWAGGPGGLIKHRTLDKLDSDEWEVGVVQLGTPILPLMAQGIVRAKSHLWCLGSDWLKSLFGHDGLNKHRGYRLSFHGCPVIATYTPMDCWAFRQPGDEDEGDESADDGKDVGVTKRSNYLFWALSDFQKLIRPERRHNQHKPFGSVHPRVAAEWLDHLPLGYKLILDIETRGQDGILDCVGLGWPMHDGSTTISFAVPFYAGTSMVYKPVDYAVFWRALYKTLRRDDIVIVGHNLAFDLSKLYHNYRLPIPPRIYDTMLAMHRHHPGVDKSLSHAISYYTDASYNHKGDLVINTGPEKLQQIIKYNGEDIYWTCEVMFGQQQHYFLSPGLDDAVDVANRMQVLALTMSFTGILVDKRVAEQKKADVSLKLRGLHRIINILVGRDFNPNSSKQCIEFFIRELGYPVIEETETGDPKMDTKTLYQLQLKQSNPLIPLIIQYRETQKELSMLRFEPYKPNEHNI